MTEDIKPKTKLFTVGNSLTVSRLVLLPIIIAGISMKIGYLAVAGMAAALLTDLLDGRISRKMGTASNFGRNLDSTIDFILLHALFIAFFAVGRITLYQFVIVYAVMLCTLVLQMLTNNADPEKGVIKTKFGKPTGALEYTYLLFLVVCEVLPITPAINIIDRCIFAVFAILALIYIIECAVKISAFTRESAT